MRSRLLLAGSYRFGYTEVTEGSAGQVPGAEVVSGGKAASGSKMGRVYIDILLLR
jgi:small ligand-binding sensory domain FIST